MVISPVFLAQRAAEEIQRRNDFKDSLLYELFSSACAALMFGIVIKIAQKSLRLHNQNL